jgi:hypothetical protein
MIVDELPVNCSACRWREHGAYTGFEVLCGLVVREIDIDKLSTRPDWCPLMSWRKYEKELDAGLDVYLGLDGLFESEDE